ncbi:hypothetical protein AB9F41_34780, partial [Rhizobium leguminosarum]
METVSARLQVRGGGSRRNCVGIGHRHPRLPKSFDPNNTRGLQALMTALFFDRQMAESLRVGEQAL